MWNWFDKRTKSKASLLATFSTYCLTTKCQIWFSQVLFCELFCLSISSQKLIFMYNNSLKLFFCYKFSLFPVVRDHLHKEGLKIGYFLKRNCNSHRSAPATIICLHAYSGLWPSNQSTSTCDLFPGQHTVGQDLPDVYIQFHLSAHSKPFWGLSNSVNTDFQCITLCLGKLWCL